MKIKNIQLTILVFLGLVILSFSVYATAQENKNSSGNIFLDSDQDGLTDQEETLYGTNPRNPDSDGDGYSDGTEVKSGYNPLKPAPGDKLETVDTQAKKQNQEAVLGTESDNLTNKVAQQVTVIMQDSQNTDGEDSGVTADQLQQIIDQSFGTTQNIEDSLPVVKKEDIKILKQNYSNLSKDEQTKRKKDDFLNYTVAVAYIFSSNSPQPITSSQDISKITTQIYNTIVQAIESRNSSALGDLEKSSDKILEQLKEVEVPEEMTDTHIKAIQYAMYGKELSAMLTPNSDDPLKDIANFSKIEAFVESLQSFTSDIQAKFVEYDISLTDSTLQNKLKDYGLDKIKVDESTSQDLTSSSDSSAD